MTVINERLGVLSQTETFKKPIAPGFLITSADLLPSERRHKTTDKVKGLFGCSDDRVTNACTDALVGMWPGIPFSRHYYGRSEGGDLI